MSSYRLTLDDLRNHLDEQVDWLKQSVSSYDAGKEHEAKRIAHIIRTLVHDTAQSHSLLQQLNLKHSLRYCSVLSYFGEHTGASLFMGVRMEMSVINGTFESRYVPNLGEPKQYLSFDKWWDDEKIIIKSGQVVTRKRAVLALANKDGGSHIDPELTELEYTMLKTDMMEWQPFFFNFNSQTVIEEEITSEGFVVTEMEGVDMVDIPSDIRSPVNVIVRQSAHELLKTLKEDLNI